MTLTRRRLCGTAAALVLTAAAGAATADGRLGACLGSSTPHPASRSGRTWSRARRPIPVVDGTQRLGVIDADQLLPALVSHHRQVPA